MRDGEVELAGVWKRFRRFDEAAGGRPKLFGRSHRGEWWWVLRDISFHVEPGERLAVVGRNGSGKSTLMKIVAGYLFPHTGTVRVGGRLNAVVEMTAGAHGELTGRENVYLLGTLAGRSRRDMEAQLPDIIEFSGLDGVIDRPFKYYSSGMRARLAFSVVMATDPDVLIVDEALAVGDAEFKQRCEQRIAELRSRGVTLLFVSHDLGSVRTLCDRAIFLDSGGVVASGDVETVTSTYEDAMAEAARGASAHGEEIRVDRVRVDAGADPGWTRIGVDLTVTCTSASPAHVRLGVAARNGLILQGVTTVEGTGSHTLRCAFEPLPLATGRHSVWVGLERPAGVPAVAWQRVESFDVTGRDPIENPWGRPRPSPLSAGATWEVATP